MSEENTAPKGCCGDDPSRLSDYHDGRYPEGCPECNHIEEHLAECPRCAEILDDFRAITAAARLMKETDGPMLDLDRMRVAVERKLRLATFYRRLAWTGAGVSAAAAVAATLFALLAPRGEKPPAQIAPIASERTERMERIEAIMAELGSDPDNLADERMRNLIMKRLEEERLVGSRSAPPDWITIHEQAGLRRPTIDLEELLERARPRIDRGVVPVGDSSK